MMRPRRVVIIDAPSVLGLFPSGVETLPEALHDHGIVTRLDAVDRLTLRPPRYDATRDPATKLKNPIALVEFARDLATVVDQALDKGLFPLVLGGDCSIIFGPLLALRRRGRHGLFFLDGHADFAHPEDEESGEAASMDLALATGRAPAAFGPFEHYRRLVKDEDVVVLGYRVVDDGTSMCRGVGIEQTGITTIGLQDFRVMGTTESTEAAVKVLGSVETEGFWIHIDADVLHDDVMPAVDYRAPDGLTWDELGLVVRSAIATGKAMGLDLTIFNPTLDPTGAIAARLVDFLAETMM